MYVWNAAAMNTPASTSHPRLRRSSALVAAHAVSARQRTKNVSGWFDRATATRIGVVATTPPATRPATEPAQRRAVTAVMTTDAVAASAFGTMTAQGEKPSALTNSAGIQNEPGILSSVTVPAGSSAPKKKLDQLPLIDSAIDA